MTKFFKVLIPVCVILLLIVGVFYIRGNSNKHERFKYQYDTYRAQLDDLLEDELQKPVFDNESTYTPEIVAIYEKVDEARNYLMKHAPHLLPEHELSYTDDNDSSVELLKKTFPEDAAKIDAIVEKAKADVEVELAAFKQELVDAQADMEMDRKRSEAFAIEQLENRRERQAVIDRLDRLMNKMRPHLIFDENGEVIGVKSPSVIPSDPDMSDSPADVPSVSIDVEEDQSPPLNNNLVEVSDSDKPAVPDSNPQLWRDTVNSDMAGLDFNFSEKYPDVMIRPYLNDAEYEKLFPTEASRQQLQRRTIALQTEYASGIRDMLSKMPRDIQSQMLELARKSLLRDWDSDFTDAVINRVQHPRDE